MTGKKDERRQIANGTMEGSIPFWKLFENVGEAVPRGKICMLFISNNFSFVIHDEASTWMPVPVSIISLIFSVGSISMGMYTRVYSVRKYIFEGMMIT